MALTQNNIIITTEFNTLKTNVQNEIERRNLHSFTFNKNLNATYEGEIQDDHFNNLIHALNEINASTTNYSEVHVSDIIRAILQLSTVVTSFAACPYRQNYNASGNSSGCSSSCVGLCTNCTGTCQGSCSGSCTGTCTGTCSGSCTGGCSGCTSCTGTCSGSCSGCSGTCSGTCSSCTGSCSGTCSGNCGTACQASGNSCTNACTDSCVPSSCGHGAKFNLFSGRKYNRRFLWSH